MTEISNEKSDCRSLQFFDYAHPGEVLQDDRLSLAQKRNILCAWASDAHAVDSRPRHRWLPGTPGPILVDHIFQALRSIANPAGKSQVIDCAMAQGRSLPKPWETVGVRVQS